MSGERLKDVVIDVEEEEREEDKEEGKKEKEEETVSLGLGLSFGTWGSSESSSSSRPRESGSPWEPAVGDSQFVASQGPSNGWPGNFGLDKLVKAVRMELRHMESFILDSTAFKRDSQHKRAKVLDYNRALEYIALSSVGTDSSSCPPTENQTGPQVSSVPFENQIAVNLIHVPDKAGSQKLMDPNSGGEDEDGTCTGNIDVPSVLNTDLLHLVFSFLDQKDLCKAGAVCQQWREVSVHENFWTSLNFENTEISQQNFKTICSRYQNATQVNLLGARNSHILVMDAVAYLRRMETLVLGKDHLGYSFFHALMDCPSLISLSITNGYLGNGLQNEITVYHERLQNLHIAKCHVFRITVRCPQLQTLLLRRTSMAHALLSCPQLHELDLSSCHKLSDAGIRSAAATCPLLEVLNISFCSCVSDETLRDISSACPNLSVLDASYCPNISLESVRFPMLMDLKLQNCGGITSSSMSAISHSQMLQALQLDNCGLLTTVSLDLPHLQKISLIHCRKFVDLTLRSPVLSYIKISNCSALCRISIISNALQKLMLQKQESLRTLSLQCNNLLEVDLSNCDSLTNSICGVFSDGGGCPRLKFLVLDNCESLTEVGLCSSTLASLSLVDCCAMTALKLSCPNLQTVNLDGCDRLEKASFCPVGIGSLNLGICPKLASLEIDAPHMSVLELKGCGLLSDASINCPCLMLLDASFCSQFMDDSLSATVASCPHIESLNLYFCLSVGAVGLSSLHQLQHLSVLDLSYTSLVDLQPILKTCSQLETLRLSACKYLRDTSFDALYKDGALPSLHELDLSYSTIEQSAVTELLSCCTSLASLNLNGCANMHNFVLGLKCHTDTSVDDCSSNLDFIATDGECLSEAECLLEILNCTGCPNIKKVYIPATAQCIYLSKLNINLSINLKEVDLSCCNLGSLNLSNCSSLEILKLNCPRLTNLQLQGCSMLAAEAVEDAISHCKILEMLSVCSCSKVNEVYLQRLRTACPSLKRIQCE